MRLILILALALSGAIANAQQKFDYWPNADYDPAIPTVESVLGHATGERITWHRDAIRYFEALAAAAPDRVAIHRYATSWEGRELIYVVVTSGENLRRIDDIKRDMQSLFNANDDDDASRIIQSTPRGNLAQLRSSRGRDIINGRFYADRIPPARFPRRRARRSHHARHRCRL